MLTLSDRNRLVQVIEEAADRIQMFACSAHNVATRSAGGPDKTDRRIIGRLFKIAGQLDEHALRTIALYDGTARAALKEGLKRDPRRSPGFEPDPHGTYSYDLPSQNQMNTRRPKQAPRSAAK